MYLLKPTSRKVRCGLGTGRKLLSVLLQYGRCKYASEVLADKVRMLTMREQLSSISRWRDANLASG